MTNPAKPTMTFRIFRYLVVAACLAVPVTTFSSPVEEGPEESASEAAPVELDASGARVAVDLVAGQVVPSETGMNRVLSKSLERALKRSAEGLQVFDLPNGGLGVPLESRFQHVVMVKVRPDGSFELECVDSARKAREFLNPKATLSADDSRVR